MEHITYNADGDDQAGLVNSADEIEDECIVRSIGSFLYQTLRMSLSQSPNV